MAYNVLKGTVEGSVDQHADQEIGGVKIFKNAISASVFYDTDAQSPCATMKDVAITKIKGGAKNSVLIYDEQTGARSHHDLTYDNGTLCVRDIKAATVQASGRLLTELPVDKFNGRISAKNIKTGHGLIDVRGNLQVSVGEGLTCEDKIELNIGTQTGLALKNGKLQVDIAKADKINTHGQNLADNDLLLVSDTSRGMVLNTTLKNFYDNYINLKVPHAAGSRGQLQLKGAQEFAASEKLTYDTASGILRVEGTTNARVVKASQKLVSEGAVYHNIVMASEPTYNVQPDDYTVLCDAVDHRMVVNLPPAVNNKGRVLIIKKTNSDKYKLTSNVVEIKCEEGPIDLGESCIIKMNYSTRTLQSDGENWWIIGSKGS